MVGSGRGFEGKAICFLVLKNAARSKKPLPNTHPNPHGSKTSGMGHLRHPSGQGRGFCKQTTQVLRGNPKGMWLLLSSAIKSMPKPADVPWDGLSSTGRAQAVGCKGEKKAKNSPNSINRCKRSRWVPEEAAGKNQELPMRMKIHQNLVPSESQGPGIPTRFLGSS